MKRITIKDIARELGIHHSTVSRALRSSPEIHPATIKRVVSYAQKHGYQVNRNALHLRGSGSNIIGVIVPNIHHNFFSNFVSIVTHLAFDSGYIVAVFQSEESAEKEKEIVKSIIQQNFAGVLASISMETTDIVHFYQLDRYKIPLVCFDRIHSGLHRSTVVLDNITALKHAVSKLCDRGFSKIAYLTGNPAIHLFHNRQKGYYVGLKENHLSYSKCIVITEGFTLEQGFHTMKQLIEGDTKPDALIFDSHILAWGALRYLKSQGDGVSAAIGMASFEGYPLLSIASPGIISIQQPEEEMARAAFHLLIEAIHGPAGADIQSVVLQATVI